MVSTVVRRGKQGRVRRTRERERAGSSERVSLEGSKSVVAAECGDMSGRNGGGSGGDVATAVIVASDKIQ